MDTRDYEIILDSMQTIAVYAIREDNHQILYYNKHVQEVEPNIKKGMVCHELWSSCCSNCPLLYIGEDSESRSINYDNPFGKSVDIIATRILWEASIPAFLITLIPHAETASYTYSKILRANLTTDRFEVIKVDPDEKRRIGTLFPTLTQWFNWFADEGNIYKADVERFRSFAREDYLREELSKGKDILLCTYRRKAGQVFRWHTMEIVPAPNYSEENQMIMLYVKDVHDVCRKGLELEENNIRYQGIIQSLGELNFGIYVIDMETGMQNPVRVSPEMKEIIDEGIFYWDKLMEKMLEHYFHPEYRESIETTFSIKALKAAAEDGKKKVELLCQRMLRGRYHYVSITAYFHKNPEGGDYVILALQDVDERTRGEIKRNLNDRRMAAIIRSRYGVMNTVDLDTGLCERIFLNQEDDNGRIRTGDYDYYIQQAIDEEIVEEDREEVRRILSLESLRKKAAQVEDYAEAVCQYRLKGPPVNWIREHVYFVRHNDNVVVNILGRDITKEKQKEFADMKMKRERANIINSLSRLFFATYYIDLEYDTFRMVNQREEVGDILGKEEKCTEAIQAYAMHFVHPEDREEYLEKTNFQYLRDTLNQDHPFVALEYRRIARLEDGTFRNDGWIRATIVQAETNDGVLKKVVYVAQDVSESKQKEEEERRILKEAYDSATYANAAKSEFLSRMSHDIRTPMNAIIGMTAIAGTHLDDSERVADCLNKITVSSKHLLSLINEVLDMSRIESGKIDLTEEEFNLSDLIQNLLTMIRPAVQAKEHDLQLRLLKVEHEDLIGDTMRIQQVFMNILGNAVKYTPQGGKLELLIKEKTSKVYGYACYEFVFRDNGIGMSEEFLKKIFEPFSRAEDSRISKIEGTGLGMTIAMNIIHMMNGNINVESRLGEGSKFTVTLYLKRQQDSSMVTERLVNLPVLVVDDDRDACEASCEILKDIGMRSECVFCGEDAVKRVQEAHQENEDFFAVILDWKMPGMDGIQTAKEIRKTVGPDIPIIILSAYDWSEIEMEARQAGINGFISKPLFKSKLVYLFKKFAGEDGRDEMPESNMDTELDFSGRRILLVEDNELNREIAEEVIGNTGVMVESVSDGKQAVEKFLEMGEGYYDLIFMDIQMPVMNGYEAADAIRRIDRADAETIPIIAMTANAFAEDVIASRNAGMNEHVSKPLNMEQLMECMKSWFGKTIQDS